MCTMNWQTQETLRSWSQKRATSRGDVHSRSTMENKSQHTEHYVVEGMHNALLGNPAIYELHLITRVESVKGSIDYRAEYPYICHGLGKMEGPYKIALKEDAQPFAIRVTLPLMDKTKKELIRMEDAV